ncbi:hypothetical protein TSUD_138120 [Trifolium subterraneum]|uniref:Uncharacterized protein n=1 Tax=Trifolium subterraneum TaxID=3900 RepID=A0A2Z6P5Y7_TRISU|nr:hypothetical protein TSUD_138120 [Trifolium subterraneum]
MEENHVGDEFEDQSHNNLLVNPISEDIDEITTLPTTATMKILTEHFSKPTGKVTVDKAVGNQGLSIKPIFSVAMDFEGQARMRNSTFRMSLTPSLDERKVVPMSVYENLDVDITGIQHDSSMFMMLHFKMDLWWFDGKCVTRNITTKGPHCEFVTLVANTLSFAMSQTKPLAGGLFSMGCTMASPWEEFAR